MIYRFRVLPIIPVFLSTSAIISLAWADAPALSPDACQGKCPIRGVEDTPSNPCDQWAWDFETAALWRISDSTHLDYVVLPQILSLRTPAHLRMAIGDNTLTVRARFSLLAEPVVRGPESLYLGFSASPSLEYWFADQTACWFTSIGGGVGWIDSQSDPGGQGQDFTLNWFATTGLRYYLKPDLAISAGAFFQHLSNGGATDPNPGLDALGPVLGLTWHF